MKPNHVTFDVEVRSAADGPELIATVTEGRAAQNRRELFTVGALEWPSGGIAIRDGHHTPELARAVPTRLPDGKIEIRTKATPELFRAVQDGRRHMSVEFHSLSEATAGGGAIREISRGLLVGAALTASPEYPATAAEVRATTKRRRLW